MKNILFTFLILATILTSWSCTDDSIYHSNQNAVQIGLYSSFGKTDKDTTLRRFSAYGIGHKDSLIYDTATVSKVFLPLKFDNDTTTFVLQAITVIDTITIIASKEEKYISREHGFTFNMLVKKIIYTNNFIDSAAINYPSIIYNENLQNVKIYIRY